MKQFIAVLAVLSLLSACSKDNRPQSEIDQEIITEYLTNNNITATKTDSGLWYNIISQGNGPTPSLSSRVTVRYKGYLTNGTVFDETGSQSVSFFLSQVILGWQEGIPYIQEGGNIHLYIPSGLGYGSRSVGNIPANSVLIFEVQLLDVQG